MISPEERARIKNSRRRPAFCGFHYVSEDGRDQRLFTPDYRCEKLTPGDPRFKKELLKEQSSYSCVLKSKPFEEVIIIKKKRCAANQSK